MFIVFMSLHTLVLMMCAIIFYFVNKNRPKFKPHLNSNQFAFYKKI
jgi:hypothetical protein